MTKAFIFDLDGTLIDSELLWCKSLGQLISSRGFTVTEAYTHELVLGRAWSDIVARLRADYPVIQDDIGAIEKETIRYYMALRGVTDIRIHSSIRLLEQLAVSHPVAIVSGSTRGQIADAIKLMGIGDCLRFYLGSEDYARGKPDPACFLKAADRFGLPSGECLVFEDSTAGVRAARAAGMRCVALQLSGHPVQDLSAADVVLSDLSTFDLSAY